VNDVLKWDLVAEMIEDGVIDKKTLEEEFKKASNGKSLLSFEGFEALLENLEPYAEEEEEEGGDDDTDGDDDAELLSSVFTSLANGKDYVSVKDLMNWDFILDLMGEALLTEEILLQKMKDCGGTEKGVKIEAFDVLVDELIAMYDVGEKQDVELQELDDDDEDDGPEDEEVIDGDGDEIDIDTEIVFQDVAKGKDFVTLQDLRDWELIMQLTKQGVMNENELQDVLETAGVDSSMPMDILAFEAILSEILNRSED